MKRDEKNKMHSLYEQWLSSGQNRAVFAKAHGYRPSTFGYWIRKFQTGTEAESKKASGFSKVDLELPISTNNGQVLTIINFPSGIRVELCFPISALYLKELTQ